MTWGWQSMPHPLVPEHHLVPLLDVGYHIFDESCACGAWSDCPGSIIHQAWDGRSAYEQGERKYH